MGREDIAETVLEWADIEETVLGAEEPGETVLDSGLDGGLNERVILNPGQTIAKDYVVINQIGKGGSQAVVYTARREGRLCAVKMYNRGYHPSEDFVKALKNHSCPYVASLYDYGYENDNYYEIYEYYGNGTLEEKGRCTLTFIKDVVIPNLNEGLHFLHTLNGNGIVHGDIKPGNLFISNDESRVVIGDFGISAYLDKRGRVIDEIKGTPEYASRTVSFFGKTTKSPAYDYGALGLVLIRLATGHSLFEGLDMTGITRMWEEGLVIPENIDSRLRRLISGLLIEDEKRRFGYEDVKKWCEGEFVRVLDNSLYSEEDFAGDEEPDPLIFGIFDERIVAVGTLPELAEAIAGNWEHTKKQLQRTTFYEFLAQFDGELERDIRVFADFPDQDKAVFFALYRIRPNPHIIYKGVDYGTPREFISGLNGSASRDQQEIIRNGLFEYFLERNGYDAGLIRQVHRIVAMDGVKPEFVLQLLFYAFSREKTFQAGGRTVSSPEELVDLILELELDDIEALAGDTGLAAWLYSVGYGDDVLGLLK